MDESFGMGRYKKETTPNKNWEYQDEGFSPKRVLPNSNFLTVKANPHEIFKVNKYKPRINLTILGGTKMSCFL